jgi:hypothetical protein
MAAAIHADMEGESNEAAYQQRGATAVHAMSLLVLGMQCRDELIDRLLPGRKLQRELHANWGQPGAGERSFLASWYFDRVRDAPDAVHVDDRTWGDLEFPRIFARFDTTLTPIGSQVLFKQLRTYAGTADESARRYALCDRLRSEQALREQIQQQLMALKEETHANIADFVFGPEPAPPKHRWLLALWGLASIAVLAATIALAWPIWIWLGMLAVNAVIAYRSMWRIFRNTATLKSCVRMLRVGNGLARLRGTGLSPLEQLADQAPQRTQALGALRWMALLQKKALEELGIPMWLTLLFLAEPIAYAFSIGRFAQIRPALASTFELIGELDAAIATASYLQQYPTHCQPTIADRALLRIVDGYHPLIAHPVSNSLELDGQSLLITGSNMAGKTTFIKMVSINLILGRTMGFCLASEATLPLTQVMTSIRSEHSVESGKSHYFAEVEAIRSFITTAEKGGHPVFVIDELFRGTNTCERVALARAVLEHLARHALVLVTTHDVELQPALKQHYALCHFRENPEIEGFFDYRLRSGASRERNAIRVLARMDFPERIVAAAMDYSMQDQQWQKDRDRESAA